MDFPIGKMVQNYMGSTSRTTEVVNLKPLPGVSAMKSTFIIENLFCHNFSTSSRFPLEVTSPLLSYRKRDFSEKKMVENYWEKYFFSQKKLKLGRFVHSDMANPMKLVSMLLLQTVIKKSSFLVGILGASPKDCFGFPKNG
jgi:hypothetical protein